MTVNWGQIEEYIYGNRVAIETTAFLVITAAIKTMPSPALKWLSCQTLKEWFYDCSHQFLNITNNRLPAPPTPPQIPPKP